MNPPLSLVEPYIKCYRDKSFSLFDAFGIGMADSDLIMRLFAYILLPFILIFLKVNNFRRRIVWSSLISAFRITAFNR